MKRHPLLLALVATLLSAAPAAATGGGDELPFNSAMTLVANNLTGPTATTVCVVMFIAGLFTVGLSRESGVIKILGWCIAICACVAKAPALMSTLGLTGANASPDGSVWGWTAAFTIGYSILIPAVACWTLRSEGERRSPSLTSSTL